MDIWTPVIAGSVLAVFTLMLGMLNKVQFDALKSEIIGVRQDLAEFKADTKARFDRVDQRFDRVDEKFDRVDERFDRVATQFDQVNRDMNALRADFTQLVMRLGPWAQPQTG